MEKTDKRYQLVLHQLRMTLSLYRILDFSVVPLFSHVSHLTIVSAKYCYVTHELRLHQNDRCKRFTLF